LSSLMRAHRRDPETPHRRISAQLRTAATGAKQDRRTQREPRHRRRRLGFAWRDLWWRREGRGRGRGALTAGAQSPPCRLCLATQGLGLKSYIAIRTTEKKKAVGRNQPFVGFKMSKDINTLCIPIAKISWPLWNIYTTELMDNHVYNISRKWQDLFKRNDIC
jgi:hypothetical protein